MAMKNELRQLIAEQAADMAGTHGALAPVREKRADHGGYSQNKLETETTLSWCERHRDNHQDADDLAAGAELTAHREALLATYHFRTRRERRIYQLHAEGMPASEIAERMHRAKSVVLRSIWRVERSVYSAAVMHTFSDLRVWHYWSEGWCPAHVARKCNVSVVYVNSTVRAAIREWRKCAPVSPSLLSAFLDCDGEFVGKLGDLTPAAVLDAAQRDPEIAEMLQRLGLTVGSNV